MVIHSLTILLPILADFLATLLQKTQGRRAHDSYHLCKVMGLRVSTVWILILKQTFRLEKVPKLFYIELLSAVANLNSIDQKIDRTCCDTDHGSDQETYHHAKTPYIHWIAPGTPKYHLWCRVDIGHDPICVF